VAPVGLRYHKKKWGVCWLDCQRGMYMYKHKRETRPHTPRPPSRRDPGPI